MMSEFDYDAPENKYLVQFHYADTPPGVSKWGPDSLARGPTREAAVEKFCQQEHQHIGRRFEVLCWDGRRRQYRCLRTGRVVDLSRLEARVVEAAARAAFIRDEAELHPVSSLESERVEGSCRQVIYDCRRARDLLADGYERSAECFMKRAESELEVAAVAVDELLRARGEVSKVVVPAAPADVS